MKKKKALGYIISSGLLATSLLGSSTIIFAESTTTPNGPWVQDEQNHLSMLLGWDYSYSNQ